MDERSRSERAKLWRTGSAILAFERGSLAQFDDPDDPDADEPGIDDGIVEPAAWHATHVERFSLGDDVAQLALALWMEHWDTREVADRALSATWVRFPEEPAVRLVEPLLAVDGENPRPLVAEAFSDFRRIDWVVTVDLVGRIFAWEPSDDPADGGAGVRRVFGFMPVPFEKERIDVWLEVMRPHERVVAQTVLAMMRFRTWSTTDRTVHVPAADDIDLIDIDGWGGAVGG